MSSSSTNNLEGIEQPEMPATDNSGPMPSSVAKLNSQIEDSGDLAEGSRELVFTLNLKRATSLSKTRLTPALSLGEQSKWEAAAAGCSQHPTTKATFNTMPAEIRVKIYAATWESRRIILTRSWLKGNDNLEWAQSKARDAGENIHDFYRDDDITNVSSSTAPIPITLWINRESRAESLRNCQITFACPRNGSSQIYFNFEIDELEIRRHTPLRIVIKAEDLRKVQSLILPMGHKAARSVTKTLGKEDTDQNVKSLYGKLDRLQALGLSSGLEPCTNQSSPEDAELLSLVKNVQQEITEGRGIPAVLSAACPSLKRVWLEPTETCGYWHTNTTILDQAQTWFLRGRCECLTCTLHWTVNNMIIPSQHDPEEDAWSVGDSILAPQGKGRDMRVGQVTFSWRAFVADTEPEPEPEPEDNTATRRTVADWALVATDIKTKLSSPSPGSEPLYVI